MNEKTDSLRDIFLEVADEETVTETQEENRGTLARSEGSVEERLLAVIERLREKFDVETPFADDELCQLVTDFYAGQGDETIAATLDTDVETIFTTRMDLHLIRDDDRSESIESAIRDPSIEEWAPATIADELGVEQAAVERIQAVVEATNRSRRASYRFRTAFEEILTDADLSVKHTADADADGLEDATDGAETNVDF